MNDTPTDDPAANAFGWDDEPDDDDEYEYEDIDAYQSTDELYGDSEDSDADAAAGASDSGDRTVTDMDEEATAAGSEAGSEADAGDAQSEELLSHDEDIPTVAPKARKIVYTGRGPSEEETLAEEMKERTDPEILKERLILILGLSGFGALFVVGLLGFADILNVSVGPLTPISWIMIGAMVFTGPYGFWKSKQIGRIRQLEERLSDFLRDLSESSRSGMTLPDAIISSAKGEYGELTPEIRKMSIQISWGITAVNAMELFAERVQTPLVERSVTLIVEASNAGGRVSSVLAAAANDTKEIQLLQQERKVQMGMYVMVILVSFMVFLVVILIVYSSFAPQMAELQENLQEQQEENPDAAGAVGGMGSTTVDFDEIKLIYILAGLVQGGGDGLVAGVMSTGRLEEGIKYSFLMVLIVFALFTFAF